MANQMWQPGKPRRQLLSRCLLTILLTALLAISLTLSACGDKDQEEANGDRGPIEIDLSLSENPTIAQIDQAEADLIAEERAALKDKLGAGAEEMFARFDEVRNSLAVQVAGKARTIGEVPGEGAANLYSNRLPPGFQPSVRPVFLRQAVSTVTMSGLMFANATTGNQDGTVNGTDSISQGGVNGKVSFNLTRSGSKTSGDYEIILSGKLADGTVVTETAKGHSEMDSCPDENGEVRLSFNIQADLRGSGPQGNVGTQFDISCTANGYVNDDASLGRIETDATVGVSAQESPVGGQARNGYAEYRTTMQLSGIGTSQEQSTGQWERTRTSSEVSAAVMDSAKQLSERLPYTIALVALVFAESGWQDGYCVEIVVDGVDDANTVKPSEKKEFTGKVRHKFNGDELQVPLQGALSGGKELKPTDRRDAPVSYTYEAPDEEDKTATVHLETRSKRGAAQKDITFNTEGKSYIASGGSEGNITGTICDLEKSFFLTEAADNGITYQYTFNPAGATSGSMSYTGSALGCTESGSGTYTVNLSEDGKSGTISYSVSGNVTCEGAGGDFSDSDSFDIQETDPC